MDSSLIENVGFFISQSSFLKILTIFVLTFLNHELSLFLFTYFALNKIIGWLEFISLYLGSVLISELLIFFSAKILRKTRLGWKIYHRLKEKKNLNFYFYYIKNKLAYLMLIFKFLPFFNFLIIFLTGWTKTKMTIFFKSYLPALLIWFIAIFIPIYLINSGIYYFKTEKIIKNAEILISGFILIIFLAQVFIRKVANKIINLEKRINRFKLTSFFEFKEATDNKTNQKENENKLA